MGCHKYHQTNGADLELKRKLAEIYVELKPDVAFVSHYEDHWPDHRESGLGDEVGRARAGSITAAQFLKRFIKDVPWAHLDIAGVVWNEKGVSLAAPGATSFGVRLLNRFIADNYEN